MNEQGIANSPLSFSPAVAISPPAVRPVASRTKRLLEGLVFSKPLRFAAPNTLRLLAIAGIVGLVSITQAIGQPVCKPALAFKDIHFSKMQPPTLERRWTAIVSVDASRCAMDTGGYFEIGFSRLKENGTELEFREQFIWLPPAVKVSVDFWADEAVEAYWIDNVAPCPCRD